MCYLQRSDVACQSIREPVEYVSDSGVLVGKPHPAMA